MASAYQLSGEILRVGDDALALQPDPIGVGVEVLDVLLGRVGDLGRLDPGLLEAILGLAARLCGDLLGGLMGALQDPRDLLAHPLQSTPDGGLRGPRRLELGHEPTGLAHVLVHGHAVIPAQGAGEVGIHERKGIFRQGLKGPGDLRKDRVLGRC